MINLTPIARTFLKRRTDFLQRISTCTERVQLSVLQSLIKHAASTEYGRTHGFSHITSYEDFAGAVPIVEYEDIRPLVMRMVSGERNVLWPGITRRFAQSSGTSGGKSKYIPVTEESLRLNHYAGARDAVAFYLAENPASRMFAGKGFILGGSFANELTLPTGVKVGDLSANLIDCINPVVNTLFRVPSKEIALMQDWEEKLPELVRSSVNQDITNISGVPSWFLTVLRRVMASAAADSIHSVWHNLEVFFHGGISFSPYREQYRAICDPSRMHYVETYNASEGFFAAQDTASDPAMMLLPDIGVFYEFITQDTLDSDSPRAIPAWQVEPGRTYALVISAANGLWRYLIGDTVKIESISPLKITIAGRTRHFINAFGEEVMVHNTDAALAAACAIEKCAAADYTVAPVFTTERAKGFHQWLIEWSTPPADSQRFAATLDKCLQDENSDYQAKRAGNIFLGQLQVSAAPRGLFDRWLASTGKLGGQRKIPRLSNSRTLMDTLLAMIADTTTDRQ